MTTEILNIEEIAKIAASATYTPGHAALLDALRQRYPNTVFNFVSTRGPGTCDTEKVVDAAGNLFTEKRKEWLTEEYYAAGDDPRAVFEKYKEAGLLKVHEEWIHLILICPFSPDPDGCLQLEIGACRELAEQHLLDKHWPPEDLDELLNWGSSYGDGIEISPWRYEFERLTNIRRFIQDLVQVEQEKRIKDLPEMEKKKIRIIHIGERGSTSQRDVSVLELHPDWLQRPIKEVRALQDWAASSAGQAGERFYDHWWFNLWDRTDKAGQRYMGFIPYWADADGDRLEKIEPEKYTSVFGLMEALEKFDSAAGYPFAWYFYMLHGNKIEFSVGERVAKGLKTGKIGLPAVDADILFRWFQLEYGF